MKRTTTLIIAAATFALSAWPAADAAPVGGGAVNGTFNYAAAGIPPSGCVDMTFQVSLQAELVVAVDDESFAGQASVQGSGQNGYDFEFCESVAGGSGVMTVSVLGTDTTGSQLRCDELSGYWGRNQAQGFFASLGGTCSVNGAVAEGASVEIHAAWVPNPAGAGVTGNVTSATVAGTARYFHEGEACDLPAAGVVLCTAPGEWLPKG